MTTTIIKIKSHAEELLNEAADNHADAGVDMYIDDNFQEPTPLLSYWRKTTAQDDQDITISKDQEFQSKATRNKYWKDQLHIIQLL